MDISKHVINHIDRAISEEWLTVYYQPIIRVLTGDLCSMESLVRWNDPEIGFLTPDQFIGFLEDAREIYKLDLFVLERVCKDLRNRMDSDLPSVPVSVNFSRLDFEDHNMLEAVSEITEKYNIPKDYLHIEITESAMIADDGLIERVIDKFHEAGFEMWMDDFGSGYSSLSMLKNYDFDQLKLDMDFLSDFSQKSRDIVRSVITMSKDLRIKTLAEGVETDEQYDFLMNTGCGKIQGFYYGKPDLIDNMFRHLEEKNISVENEGQRKFYEAACREIRHTDVPLEIIEDTGTTFKTLFMNKAYKKQIFDDNPDLDEIDRRVYSTPSPLLKKYRDFAELLKKTGKEETFFYTAKGDYYRFTGRVLAEYEGHYLIKGSLFNISSNPNSDKSKMLDSRLRELNQLFTVVHLLDLHDDSVEPLLGRYRYISNHVKGKHGIKNKMNIFQDEYISPEDLKRSRDFLDIDTLKERIQKSDKGYIHDVFAIKQEDGSYKPEEILLMPLPGSGGEQFLFCMKDIIWHN